MKAIYLWAAGAVVVLVGGFFLFNSYIYQAEQGPKDYKDATYMIEGQPVALVHGVAETEAAPGSASKVTTKYFGNEAKGDLNGDGIPDIAFLLTQETGGSGTFFYLVAAVQNADGTYSGTDGVLLGDRIAPQTTEITDGKVIVNYADRAASEPMTAQPSVGKSLYLKLDTQTMQFGIVEQNFSGEAADNLTEAEARTIAQASCIKGGEALAAGVHDRSAQTWSFNANLNATQPGCTPLCVVSEVTKTASVQWKCVNGAQAQ